MKIEKPKLYTGYAFDLDDSDKRKKKYLKQIEETGFDDTETWNLDVGLIQYLLPRLKRFKEVHNGYPDGLTSEEYDKILNKMIEGFDLYIIHKYDILPKKSVQKKINHAFKLLHIYWFSLWW